MDPITIALIATGALAGTGGVAAWWARRNATQRQEAMRLAVQTSIPCGNDAPVSLLDLFWDLGASDFTLEMLAHGHLLLDEPAELSVLMRELPSRIAEAGSYRALVDELLEAISVYSQEHRGAGDRRAIPALAAPAVKALPAAGGSGGTPMRLASQDWEGWRTGQTRGALVAEPAAATDLENALSTGVGSLLSGLFEGNFGQEFKRWNAQREAKRLRDDLDRALEDLLGPYLEHVAHDARAHEFLRDSAHRWTAEKNRIEVLRGAGSFGERSWASCADALLEASSGLAASMAEAAERNVAETLARIDELAAEDQKAMAGYLVYVNRHALFVGRMGVCEDEVKAVERASAALRVQLLQLERKGLA